MFKVNHEEANPFEIFPDNTEVEVYPIVFDTKTSQSGNQMVVFNYKIRDDVEQVGKGREIRFDNFVDTPNAHWRLQAASKAADFEDGLEFETIEAWAKEFKGRAVRLVLGIREYNGKEYNEVKGFKESKVGGYLETNVSEDDPFANQGNVNITDDDLPF